MDKLNAILTELGLGAHEQTVYLSLLREGQATARMLAARTGITRPSVYDQLKLLRKRGLVVELDLDGKTFFSPTDPEHLDVLMADKISELESGRAVLASSLPTLRATVDLVQPKVRFFEGRDGVQQLMKDMLWYDNLEILVLWPHTSMVAVLGEAFITWFDERRAKRGVSVRALWPLQEKRGAKRPFARNEDGVVRRYVKEMPDMGYIIYGQKVMFIGSGKETFGFIVDSAEFAALMRLQYEALWSGARG